MTDKEKIRAEVESYKEAAEFFLKGNEDREHWLSQKDTCEKLLSFIDSMKENPKTDWLQELKEKLDSLSKEDFKKVFNKYAIDFNEEPISEDLEKAMQHNAPNNIGIDDLLYWRNGFIAGTKWQKEKEYTCYEEAFEDGAKWKVENLWKPADGDDLPEIDREVIALLDNGKVVFAHRPPEYWDGKNIATGKVTRYYPKTYDKGGWNIPDIVYWLDVKLPKEIEL